MSFIAHHCVAWPPQDVAGRSANAVHDEAAKKYDAEKKYDAADGEYSDNRAEPIQDISDTGDHRPSLSLILPEKETAGRSQKKSPAEAERPGGAEIKRRIRVFAHLSWIMAGSGFAVQIAKVRRKSPAEVGNRAGLKKDIFWRTNCNSHA